MNFHLNGLAVWLYRFSNSAAGDLGGVGEIVEPEHFPLNDGGKDVLVQPGPGHRGVRRDRVRELRPQSVDGLLPAVEDPLSTTGEDLLCRRVGLLRYQGLERDDAGGVLAAAEYRPGGHRRRPGRQPRRCGGNRD
jgi:hypothetical protein